MVVRVTLINQIGKTFTKVTKIKEYELSIEILENGEWLTFSKNLCKFEVII